MKYRIIESTIKSIGGLLIIPKLMSYFSFNLKGVVTLPMTFISNTPIECTIHPDLWFSDTFTLKNNSIISSSEFSMAPTASTGKASVVSIIVLT